MDVVALVSARDHPSTRYRIAQYSRSFESLGLKLVLDPLEASIRGRIGQLTGRVAGQLVLVQRKLLPLWQLALLRRAARLLVYDFDDAVYVRDSFHPRGPASWTRKVRFRAMVTLADCVLAGNRYLADQARRWTDPAKVHVIPTSVDSRRYEVAQHGEQDPLRLVWIGTSSSLRCLEAARPLLEAIGRAVPGTILRVVCDRFPRFRHLEVERTAWSAEGEARLLGESDIGISWVPDDPWSRGKCGLKVLQYMAAGLPVVASPVGVHPHVVGPAAGFLPASPGDWIERITELARQPSLRRRMGLEGRRRLEDHFDLATWGPVLARRLVEAGGRR